MWIPFRQYNIPSKDFGKDADGCVAAVRNVMMESARGPTLLCCNDADKATDGGAGLNVSLAAYLMNANEGSYFGPGEHWANAGWDHVFDNFPQLTLPLGPPSTPSFRSSDDGYSFYRTFEHLDVTLHCRPSGGRCGSYGTESACDADADCNWTPRSEAMSMCTDRPTAVFEY